MLAFKHLQMPKMVPATKSSAAQQIENIPVTQKVETTLPIEPRLPERNIPLDAMPRMKANIAVTAKSALPKVEHATAKRKQDDEANDVSKRFRAILSTPEGLNFHFYNHAHAQVHYHFHTS